MLNLNFQLFLEILLIFKLELLSPIRRGIMQMKGQAFVDGKLTCEAELLAKIIKKTEA
jgi:UDP-3-O-[3-hydroxymyristoyl] N-acetylglucosamine deacetylase/3-hydroxyacyl-[acyl-carrier-protein] dehydratase